MVWQSSTSYKATSSRRCSRRAWKLLFSPTTKRNKKYHSDSLGGVSPSKVCASRKQISMPILSNPACNGCSPTCVGLAARGGSIPKPWTVTSGKSGLKTVGSSAWEFGFRRLSPSSFYGHSPSPAIFSCGFKTGSSPAQICTPIYLSCTSLILSSLRQPAGGWTVTYSAKRPFTTCQA